MNMQRSLLFGALTITAGFLAFDGSNGPAEAQTIFCPSGIPNQPGITLSNATCTNLPNPKGTGAYSNAALASEALSDVAQSTTQRISATVETTLGNRRQTELERCPDGFERVNGVCQRIMPAEAPAVAPAPPPPATAAPSSAPAPSGNPPAGGGGTATRRAASSTRPARRPAAPRVAARPAAPVYKAPPPPPPLEQAVRYGSWVEGFGDFERRTGTSQTSITCCQGVGGQPNGLALSGESRATTAGVLGGADATWRNVWGLGDAIMLGVLTGYMSSDVRLTTTSISGSPNNVGNGANTLNAHLDGPSAGAYVTYFNDRFSAGATFRADFLNLSESFIDSLAYTVNGTTVNGQFQQSAGTGVTVPFAGSGSTRLTNYTTNGNLNYRIPVSPTSWIEPTAGVQYTFSDYDASAAALGLSNGHLVKVQGGARYGFDYFWGAARLTTTLTGLAYDDVEVTGGFIQNVAFGNNALIINDQGLLRGEGILAFNLAFPNGWSVFALGDVRGGKDLFGAGGKGGIRFQW
jgi:hypothetical protein